jgi:PPM family protein phosphatase
MNFAYVGQTDVGKRRSENEDAFLIESDIGLLAVADGMGGAASGEVASALFIETVREIFRSPVGHDRSFPARIEEVFAAANAYVIREAMNNERHRGMGCTAELWITDGTMYFVGHIGDSRTYLYRGGELRQLTKDHSMVQDEIDRGAITAEQAKSHPFRNVITRAIGVSVSIAVDIIRDLIHPNDIFLLCSDGLTDMVSDREIASILAKTPVLDEAAARLIETANLVGGRDNITVVLCGVHG